MILGNNQEEGLLLAGARLLAGFDPTVLYSHITSAHIAEVEKTYLAWLTASSRH